MTKVVSSFEFSESGICQNPLLPSNLLNIFSSARFSSTVGSGCTSQMTLAFSGLKSIHMRMEPFFLGATTIPAHQGVGMSTGEIILFCFHSASIRSSSALTCGCRGSGI